MKIKSEGRRGKRSICTCLNCKIEFSELNIKIRQGKGKFCSSACYQEYRRNHRKDSKEANRLYQKKNKYKLSAEEYYSLFQKQNNSCAVCGVLFDNHNRAFVDHSHSTGAVRGLLCIKCNSLLGMANDDIKILHKAIEYLNKRT